MAFGSSLFLLDLFNEFKLFYYTENEILETFKKTGHINITDKNKIVEEEKKNKKRNQRKKRNK